MELKFWAATDVGRKRDHNEDNFLIDGKLQLFVVADGMGGHAAGEVASSLAVHEVREAVIGNRDVIDRFAQGDTTVARLEILQALEHAVQAACAAIYRRAQQEPEKRGMGTTCSVLMVVGERGFISHVGDTRIYLLRQEQVHQLTEDHSLVNELVRRGKLKRDEIDASPYKDYKNAVTRAVGVYETVEPDTLDFDLLPGDQFLLCSDGLSAYLEPPALPALFRGQELTEVAKELIRLANDGGGHDNITAVVIRVPDRPGADTRAEELNLKLEVLKAMPLFKHLTYKELVRLLNITEVRDYAAGDRIISEGEAGDEMFVLLRGRVRLHKGDAFITTLGAGAHFGEMALVDKGPRSASASAEEAARLLLIRRRDFYAIIKKEAALSVKLLWSFVQVLAERLRKTTAELSEVRLEAVAEDLSDDAEALFEEPSSR